MDRELQKNKAIELMQAMGYSQEYIEDLKERDIIYAFINGLPMPIKYFKALQQKVNELEASGSYVFGIVQNEVYNGNLGVMYNFLIVPKYQEDWNNILNVYPCVSVIYAYVQNVSIPEHSEYGYISLYKNDQGQFFRST